MIRRIGRSCLPLQAQCDSSVCCVARRTPSAASDCPQSLRAADVCCRSPPSGSCCLPVIMLLFMFDSISFARAWRAGGGKHTRKHENNGAGNEALLLPLIDMTNTNTHAETRTDTHRDARTQTQVQLKAGET